MKKALPANAKISKDAKETVQECVSEFISFITGEASDKCQREKRKTINGDDLLWAMTTLGFEDYVEPLKVYLQRFRELEGERSAMVGLGRGEREQIQHNGSGVNIAGLVGVLMGIATGQLVYGGGGGLLNNNSIDVGDNKGILTRSYSGSGSFNWEVKVNNLIVGKNREENAGG
ncbi:hypothetical protein Ancab_024970 [Ancistrocladus abbreviatus]